MIRIGEIEYNRAMWLSPTTVAEGCRKIDGSAKVKAAIRVDINIEGFVVCRCIYDSNVSRLNEIVCHHNMFLVWGDLDVMGANRRLIFIGVIETFGVVQVGNVEGSDMISCC